MPDQMTFIVEDARIFKTNFAGRELPPYNREGSRNFLVALDPQDAKQMDADGWNVKFPKPGEEDEKDPFISVQLGYTGGRPPLIVMITSTGRKTLNEKSVEILDSLDLGKVDLIANASHWSNSTGSGIKAYLKTMFVTIQEDALMRKYGMSDIGFGSDGDDEDAE